jgi:hypothetical protein
VALAFERHASILNTRKTSALMCLADGFQLVTPLGLTDTGLQAIAFPELPPQWSLLASRQGSSDWQRACALLFTNGTTMAPAILLNASRACFDGRIAVTPTLLSDEGSAAAVRTHVEQRIEPAVRALRALVDANDACRTVTVVTAALNRLNTDVAAMLLLADAPGGESRGHGSRYDRQSMALELTALSAAVGFQGAPLLQAADLAASPERDAYVNTSSAAFVGKIAPIDRIRLLLTAPPLDVLARRLMPMVPLWGAAEQSSSISLLPYDDSGTAAAPVAVPAVLEPLSAFVGLTNRFIAATAMTANATLLSQRLGLNTSAWMIASASAVRSCRLLAAQLVEEVLQDAARNQEAAQRHLVLSVLLAMLLPALLYALLVVCYGEKVRRDLLLRTAESSLKSQTVRYLSHEARGCSAAALLAAGLLEDAIRDRSLGADAVGEGTAVLPATAAPSTTARASSSDSTSLPSPRDVGRLPAGLGDLQLLATIKEALQQQTRVFTDALDWEKVGADGFALEMQPTAIVDCVSSAVRMHVSVLCAGSMAGTAVDSLTPGLQVVVGANNSNRTTSLPLMTYQR